MDELEHSSPIECETRNPEEGRWDNMVDLQDDEGFEDHDDDIFVQDTTL